MMHPIRQFEDFARMLEQIPTSQASSCLFFMQSNIPDGPKLIQSSSPSAIAYWQPFRFSSLYSLASEQMTHTANQIIKLASIHFFEILKRRFFTLQGEVGDKRYFSSIGKEVMGEELTRLYALTERVVERLADLYGLHPQDVSEHVESLTAQNLQQFSIRLETEANSVPAFYLGNSTLPLEYAAFNAKESSIQNYADLLTRIVSKQEGPYLPLACTTLSLQEHPDITETMAMEFISTEMTYRLAQLPSEQVIGQKLNLFVTGKGKVTYQIEDVIDLWEQLIAYKLCPESDEGAPNILAFRGTQRMTHLPGFWGSMISIWHPNGPGGNVVQTKKIFELEDMILQSAKKWIFTGHSMGAKIAVAFAKRERLSNCVLFVHSFGSPGRDKDHACPGMPSLKAAHIGSLHDPVFQLGGSREGQTCVIVTQEEPGRPQAAFETIHRVAESVLQHHSRAQLVANESWILSRIPEGGLIARYSPLWGFAHRFLSHHLYGPLKMIVLVLRAVWPLFAKLYGCIYQRTRNIIPNFHPAASSSLIPASESQGKTSLKVPLALEENLPL